MPSSCLNTAVRITVMLINNKSGRDFPPLFFFRLSGQPQLAITVEEWTLKPGRTRQEKRQWHWRPQAWPPGGEVQSRIGETAISNLCQDHLTSTTTTRHPFITHAHGPDDIAKSTAAWFSFARHLRSRSSARDNLTTTRPSILQRHR